MEPKDGRLRIGDPFGPARPSDDEESSSWPSPTSRGTKRGRDRGPRSASDLDREMDNYHGKADKPGKRAKPTADELDAEMDAYNKAAATGAVAAEA